MIGEDDVRTVGAGSKSRTWAGLLVLNVGVVLEDHAATAGVGAEVARFEADASVTGSLEEGEEKVTDRVVALGDMTTGNSGATDDVAHPVRESEELLAGRRRRSSSDVVSSATDGDVAAAWAGEVRSGGGGGVLGANAQDQTKVSAHDVFGDADGRS